LRRRKKGIIKGQCRQKSSSSSRRRRVGKKEVEVQDALLLLFGKEEGREGGSEGRW